MDEIHLLVDVYADFVSKSNFIKSLHEFIFWSDDDLFVPPRHVCGLDMEGKFFFNKSLRDIVPAAVVHSMFHMLYMYTVDV